MARKRQEMIRPKSKDEVAFEQLERALSSGTSTIDEVRVSIDEFYSLQLDNTH